MAFKLNIGKGVNDGKSNSNPGERVNRKGLGSVLANSDAKPTNANSATSSVAGGAVASDTTKLQPTAAPKKSLAEMLAASKDKKPDASSEDKPIQSPLNALLAKQKEGQTGTSIVHSDSTSPEATPQTPIPPVTVEKYQIVANASEFLKDEVIEEFTSNMQAVLDAMGTLEIGDAMERVLQYAQEHSELVDILRPEDIQIFVRGARASYAKVLTAKTTRKKKVTKKAERLSATASEIDDIFAGVEMNI